MKKQYQEPQAEVVRIETAQMLAASAEYVDILLEEDTTVDEIIFR